jgi:hypothetical protein
VLEDVWRLSMSKTFDAVKFQRERRTEMSKKLSKMTAREIVEYFKKVSPPIPKKKKNTRRRT